MLEIKTDLCRDALAPVATEIFKMFFDCRDTWKQCLAILAELDCYQSLAVASNQLGPNEMCRPEIIRDDVKTEGGYTKPMLELKNLQHPMLALNFKQNRRLVSNTI